MVTTREEMVRRAADLVPILRERAPDTEECRQPLPETVEDLKAAQLITAAQPQRYGGQNMDLDVVFDIAAELGRGCGSTSWCYSIWASHNWLVALFPEEAQEEYWADDPNTLSSTSFNPARGKLEAAEGGYLLSGQWDFSSGCDAAAWALLIAVGDTGPRMLLMPRRDYEIMDTWFVSGLKGTGSKDIVVKPVFVPEYRTVSMVNLREGTAPGGTYTTPPTSGFPRAAFCPLPWPRP